MRVTSSNAGPTVRVSATEPTTRRSTGTSSRGVEYGRRGYNIADRLGLVRQQYFKFAIGFTLFAGQMENGEYWFMRSKFD